MLVVVMGIAGSGKTTVGRLLAEALQCAFVDGDDLHPAANIALMRRGIPLTDGDRAPWLAAIHATLRVAHEHGECVVVACSALRQSYRDAVAGDLPVEWVYLKGPAELIRERLLRRTGHFMGAGMLASQVATLEEPTDAIVVDVSPPPGVVVESIVGELRESRAQRTRREAPGRRTDRPARKPSP